MVAREIGHAASDEAKDLGLAATRKVRELGERREHRRAEKFHATVYRAPDRRRVGCRSGTGRGQGSHGRITAKDVRSAGEE